MHRLVIIFLMAFFLAGCSAASLKKAEENTRLAGTANPIGAAIHLPVWAVSTVANAGSGSSDDGEVRVVKSAISEDRTIEKRRQRWRPGLPGDISREAYEALSDD